MQNKKIKTKKEKIKKPKFKAFKLQRFINRKKNLNLKKQSNKFCKKPKENICLLPLCDFSKLIFSTLFEKDIK
jgi:hypothetical protein